MNIFQKAWKYATSNKKNSEQLAKDLMPETYEAVKSGSVSSSEDIISTAMQEVDQMEVFDGVTVEEYSKAGATVMYTVASLLGYGKVLDLASEAVSSISHLNENEVVEEETSVIESVEERKFNPLPLVVAITAFMLW